MTQKTATKIASQIASKETTSFEATQYFTDRIKKFNPDLNAIVIDNTDVALEAALQYDENPTGGSLGGVPITLKESFNMKGLKTTCNFKSFANYVAPEDSVVTKRMYAEGANILGKTNIPVLLGDHQSFGPFYPTANNPWDLNKTPGGSTGGGAAAVAAGLTTFEIGSDIGGSIRVPCHFCGIFGLKPSENMYVELGHLPAMPNSKVGWIQMASYGPLARTMEDLELAYDIACAPDFRHRINLPVQSTAPIREKLSDYKVGWINEIGGYHAGVDTKSVMDNFIQKIKTAGVDTNQFTFSQDWFDKIVKIWGVFFGLVNGAEQPWFVRQLLKRRFAKMDRGAKLNISKHIQEGFNNDFLSYTKTLRLRQLAIAELHDYLTEYDFIISPVMMGPAFDHNHKHQPISIDGKKVPYVDHNLPFPMPWNSLGNPGLVVPAGKSREGLPIGLQIIGPVHSEKALIHFGKMIENLGFRYSTPEGYA